MNPELVDSLFLEVVREAASTFRGMAGRKEAFDVVKIGADEDPTTMLDQRLEDCVIAVLRRHLSSGKVLSEEAGTVFLGAAESDGPTFVLDPLDGTSNAAIGFPYCALSLALLEGTRTDAGCVYNYCSSDLFIAQRGRGATRNGTPLRVAPETPDDRLRVVLSRPFNHQELPMYASCTLEAKRVRMTGSPALDVASVASGSFHAYADFHVPCGLVKTHDVIAARLLLEEAGGMLLDECGEPLELQLSTTAGYNLFAVNSPSTYQRLREYFHAK